MENASNAIIIAGTILIAMVVIGIGVYLVASYVTVGESYEQKAELEEIENYNSHFTTFEGRKDITTQEIVTLIRYNEKYAEKTGIKAIITPDISENNQVETIKQNSDSPAPNGPNSVTFNGYECDKIEYNENTGRVKEIRFKSVTVVKTKPVD